MNKLEFENERISIYCNETYRYVFVQFINESSLLQYRAATQKVIDVLEEKNMKHLISDESLLSAHSDEREKWIHDFIVPQLLAQRVRKYGIITSTAIEQANVKRSTSSEIKLSYFSSVEEAEKWILLIE